MFEPNGHLHRQIEVFHGLASGSYPASEAAAHAQPPPQQKSIAKKRREALVKGGVTGMVATALSLSGEALARAALARLWSLGRVCRGLPWACLPRCHLARLLRVVAFLASLLTEALTRILDPYSAATATGNQRLLPGLAEVLTVFLGLATDLQVLIAAHPPPAALRALNPDQNVGPMGTLASWATAVGVSLGPRILPPLLQLNIGGVGFEGGSHHVGTSGSDGKNTGIYWTAASIVVELTEASAALTRAAVGGALIMAGAKPSKSVAVDAATQLGVPSGTDPGDPPPAVVGHNIYALSRGLLQRVNDGLDGEDTLSLFGASCLLSSVTSELASAVALMEKTGARAAGRAAAAATATEAVATLPQWGVNPNVTALPPGRLLLKETLEAIGIAAKDLALQVIIVASRLMILNIKIYP